MTLVDINKINGSFKHTTTTQIYIYNNSSNLWIHQQLKDTPPLQRNATSNFHRSDFTPIKRQNARKHIVQFSLQFKQSVIILNNFHINEHIS